MNLFEQQALMQRDFMPPAVATPALQAKEAMGESAMPAVAHFIEGANLEQCSKVAIHLSARLFTLEQRHSGMRAANVNEAAHFVADAVLDIEAAMKAEDEVPCSCGQCDECMAARSDEHYDRRRDGIAT